MTSMSDLQGTDRAPVELVLIEFPGNEFKGEILTELSRLVETGTIRLMDALLVRKDVDGTTQWLEAADAGDSVLAELVGAPAGLLAEDDVHAIADELAPGSSVGMMVFEHTWATRLTAAIRNADGQLIDWARVPAAAVDELLTLIDREG